MICHLFGAKSLPGPMMSMNNDNNIIRTLFLNILMDAASLSDVCHIVRPTTEPRSVRHCGSIVQGASARGQLMHD